LLEEDVMEDKREKRIINVSDKILEKLINYRNNDPTITFALRTRNSSQSKEKRLESGKWFQGGKDYILLPLFKKGDTARKVKTVGFVLKFNTNGDIIDNFVQISFKGGNFSKDELEFHKELASKYGISLNNMNHGSIAYSNQTKYLSNLEDYLINKRKIALELLEKYNLKEKYIVKEKEFLGNLNKIEKIRHRLLIKDHKDLDKNDYIYSFIIHFRKNYSANTIQVENDILKNHLNQNKYETSAKKLSEELEFKDFRQANLFYGSLAEDICSILKKSYKYNIEILCEFRQQDKELHWVLRPDVVDALNDFFSMSEEGKDIFIEKYEKSEINKINYWIFQGNPNHYDVVGALRDNALKTWSVKSFKSKIRKGDKLILWIVGEKPGCYALCDVSSNPYEDFDSKEEEKYYVYNHRNEKTLQVDIRINTNLYNNPILWEKIKGMILFSDFKAGNQGTNFSSTKEEYETMLKLANNKNIDPMNLILYGPPGTGKTYHTINKALEIIVEEETNSDVLDTNEIKRILVKSRSESIERAERETLQTAFNHYKEQKQIEFITFHQSYSYEDFVEGIKPGLDKNEVRYKMRKGVFKKISTKAKENLEKSRKTDRALKEEEILNLRIQEFFNKYLESGEEFQKTQGGKFKITDQNDEVIEIESEDSKYSEKRVLLSIDEFKKIVRYEKDFVSSRNMAQIVFGIKNQRQKDTYYFNILKSYKRFDFGEIETTSVEKENEKNYVLIIDEINRGNVASIFGELITLIEKDKRIGTKYGMTARLPYSGEDFGVPANLHIIGTMNTADRSVEALDAALRRRFQFKEMMPEPELFEKEEWKWKKFDIKKLLETMNKRLEILLDRDHKIGHSYFMVSENERTEEKLRDIFEFQIIPQLREYFFGDPEKMRLVLGDDFFKKPENKVNPKNDFDSEGYQEYFDDYSAKWTLKDPQEWSFTSLLKSSEKLDSESEDK